MINLPPRPPLASMCNRIPTPSLSIAGGKQQHSNSAQYNSITGTNMAVPSGQAFAAPARVFSKQHRPRRCPSHKSGSALPDNIVGVTSGTSTAAPAAKPPAGHTKVVTNSNQTILAPSRMLQLQQHLSSKLHTGAALHPISSTVYADTAAITIKSFRRHGSSNVSPTAEAHSSPATLDYCNGGGVQHCWLNTSDPVVVARHQPLSLPVTLAAAASMDASAASADGLYDLRMQDLLHPAAIWQQQHQNPAAASSMPQSSGKPVSVAYKQQQQQESGQPIQQQGVKLTLNLFGASAMKETGSGPASSDAAGNPVITAAAWPNSLGVLPLGSVVGSRQQQQHKTAHVHATHVQIANAQQQPSKRQRKCTTTTTTATAILAHAALATAMPSLDAAEAASRRTGAADIDGTTATTTGNVIGAATYGSTAGKEQLRLPLLPLTAAEASKQAPSGFLAQTGRTSAAVSQGCRLISMVETEAYQHILANATDVLADSEHASIMQWAEQQYTHQQKEQRQQQGERHGSIPRPVPLKSTIDFVEYINVGCGVGIPAPSVNTAAVKQNTQKQEQQVSRNGKRPRPAYKQDDIRSSSGHSEADSDIHAASSSSNNSGTYSAEIGDGSGDLDGSERSGSIWSGGISAAAAGHTSSDWEKESSGDEQSWLVDESCSGCTAAKRIKSSLRATKTAAQNRQARPAALKAAKAKQNATNLQVPHIGQHVMSARETAATAAAAPVKTASGVPESRARTSSRALAQDDAVHLAPGEVPVMLPSIASLSRQKVLLVELPGCFDITGDSGAVGRIVCSRNPAAASTATVTAAMAVHNSRARAPSTCAASGKHSSKAGKAAGNICTHATAAGVTVADKQIRELATGSGSDSDDDFAQQLKALLNAPAPHSMPGLEVESEQYSDLSEEEGVKDSRADVDAVNLDLKGLVFSTQMLPLSGTAAVVRINLPANKLNNAMAHVEHLFSSSFMRAVAGPAEQQLADDLAAFEFDDDIDDNVYGTAAAEIAKGEADEQLQLRFRKGSSRSACGTRKGGGKKGGRAAGAAAARGSAVGGIHGPGCAQSGKRKPTGGKRGGRKAARRAARKA